MTLKIHIAPSARFYQNPAPMESPSTGPWGSYVALTRPAKVDPRRTPQRTGFTVNPHRAVGLLLMLASALATCGFVFALVILMRLP